MTFSLQNRLLGLEILVELKMKSSIRHHHVWLAIGIETLVGLRGIKGRRQFSFNSPSILIIFPSPHTTFMNPKFMTTMLESNKCNSAVIQ